MKLNTLAAGEFETPLDPRQFTSDGHSTFVIAELPNDASQGANGYASIRDTDDKSCGSSKLPEDGHRGGRRSDGRWFSACDIGGTHESSSDHHVFLRQDGPHAADSGLRRRGTSEDRALLAEFSAKALDNAAIKAMRVD